MHIQPTGDSPQHSRYLGFTLSGLEYGLDFGKVQELRVLKSLERFAADGEIVEGVAVSRGVIMPIVDMRAAFSGRPAPLSPNTDVIILQLSACVVGLLVDGVTGVVTLHEDQIMPIPRIEDDEPADYLIGLGRVEARRLILVDIDKLMSIQRVAQRAKVVA
ncbi:MAG TPA: chemotaxis protein CheW [Telluria sp.]|nr:chemotaxis protein CheW [Telluria sp.]